MALAGNANPRTRTLLYPLLLLGGIALTVFLGVLGFFVVACINAVWCSIAVAHDFMPRVSVVFTMVLVTASLLIMVPYFAYVFDFLDPDRIVGRIQQQAVAAALDRGPLGGSL